MQSDNDRAIADCTEAIKLDPKFTFAYNNRGAAYHRKGDNDRAIADCTQAIRLNPNDAAAYHNRGAAYAGKGDYNRVAPDLEAALRLNPNDQSARTGLNSIKEYQAKVREQQNARDDAMADAMLKEFERRIWNALMGGGSSSGSAGTRVDYWVEGYCDVTRNGKTERYTIKQAVKATSEGDARQQVESMIRNQYPTVNNINITRIYR